MPPPPPRFVAEVSQMVVNLSLYGIGKGVPVIIES